MLWSPDAKADPEGPGRDTARAQKPGLGHVAPRPGRSPVCDGGLNQGSIFSLHGIRPCTKQSGRVPDPSSTKEVASSSRLAARCLRVQEPMLGRVWGSGLCRPFRPPGPQGDHAAPTPTPRHPAVGLPGPCGRFLLRCSQAAGAVPHVAVGPWDHGTVGLFPPSLSDPPSGGLWEVRGDFS